MMAEPDEKSDARWDARYTSEADERWPACTAILEL
jgi:hypothetical protein